MKKNFLKKIGILATLISAFIISAYSNAQYEIIPELSDIEIEDVNEQILKIGMEGGAVRDNYNDIASKISTEEQLASGIMNRDTIMNYLTYAVQFLSQIGLAVGAGFIIYAGYGYMTSVFRGGKTPTSTIKNAIIGVLIITFAYGILKILTSLAGLS